MSWVLVGVNQVLSGSSQVVFSRKSMSVLLCAHPSAWPHMSGSVTGRDTVSGHSTWTYTQLGPKDRRGEVGGSERGEGRRSDGQAGQGTGGIPEGGMSVPCRRRAFGAASALAYEDVRSEVELARWRRMGMETGHKRGSEGGSGLAGWLVGCEAVGGSCLRPRSCIGDVWSRWSRERWENL